MNEDTRLKVQKAVNKLSLMLPPINETLKIVEDEDGKKIFVIRDGCYVYTTPKDPRKDMYSKLKKKGIV